MRIAFAGTPNVAVPSLHALSSGPHELVAVVTRPDAPAGRGRHLVPSAVAQAVTAAGLEVPLLKPAHPKDPEFQEQLKQLELDAVAVVAYGALIPDSALAIPAAGWINLHFSLLPAWRGAAPVQRAIWAGDDITGATTFQIVHDLDSGPVYGQMTYGLPPRATSGQVLAELAEQAAPLLVKTLDAIEQGVARAVLQTDYGVSLAAKVTPAEGQVTWDKPALAIDRQVRACTPAPGAWTTFRGQRLKLEPVDPAPNGPGLLVPGRLTATRDTVWVGTATNPVRLGRVAPAGKGWMDAASWARGARFETGETL